MGRGWAGYFPEPGSKSPCGLRLGQIWDVDEAAVASHKGHRALFLSIFLVPNGCV
jgi:hypothetical protein